MINLLPEEHRNKAPLSSKPSTPILPLHQPEPAERNLSKPTITDRPAIKSPPPTVARPPINNRPVTSPPAESVNLVNPARPVNSVLPKPLAAIPIKESPPSPQLITKPVPPPAAKPIFSPARQPLSNLKRDSVKFAASSAVNKNFGIGVNLVPTEILGHTRSREHLLAVAGMATGTITVIGVLFLILVAVEIRAVSQLSSVVVETQKVTEQIGALDVVRFEAKQLANLTGAVKTIVNEHVVWTPFFSWLEENTLPEVTYRTMNADVGGIVTLQVEAPSLDTLVRQYRVFKQSPTVKTVELKDFTTAFTEGGTIKAVTAALRLGLEPGLFHLNTKVETSSQPIKLRR